MNINWVVVVLFELLLDLNSFVLWLGIVLVDVYY